MNHKVLLVDDEPNIAMTLALLLRSEGCYVQTASSAQSAKECLARSAFDLVVTDVSMETPVAGYEVVKAARKLPKPPATLVISGFPELLNRWEAEGANAGLQKPTELPELLATIERLLGKP
jgi:two-component system CheB/CheR fusion protein